METKLKEIHQHPDTTLSPLTVLHKLVPTQGLPQRNHLIPQPAVASGTTLTQYQSSAAAPVSTPWEFHHPEAAASPKPDKLGTRKAPRNTVTYRRPGPALSGQGSCGSEGFNIAQATVIDNHYQLLYYSHRLHVHGPVPSPWN